MSSDAAPEELLLRARGIGKAYTSIDSPMSRLGEALFRRESGRRRKHVVLDGIDLDVRRGETLGIMGRNGAGKTTLLAILGRVLEPSAGTVERLGRIATLLEVGAGFNPQFSGRDNAKLFCGIMGLTTREAAAVLPEIEAFADLGEYFEMPLRTYSSGMQARLGFACAAHVEADLVIIDETLAVGDAAFRVKCYMRIKAMQERGQTFLMVSHSPNLIANFCSRVVVLEGGRKVFDGAPVGAFEVYKDIREGLERRAATVASVAKPVTADDPRLTLRGAHLVETWQADGPPLVELTAELVAGAAIARPILSCGIRNKEGIVVCGLATSDLPQGLAPMQAGESRRLRLVFRNRLLPGIYFLAARTGETVGDVTTTFNVYHNLARLDVVRDTPSRGLVDLDMRISADAAAPVGD
ncbi:ABC transporter ATP-binding protein [Falsiroseomonas sp.]|uniref:ABC transporter ATP-binding protein n=1 Tax=Falsiroseomonas sp. TaxID=2870721 RepID=UPI003564E360